jgi:hypothetical protein
MQSQHIQQQQKPPQSQGKKPTGSARLRFSTTMTRVGDDETDRGRSTSMMTPLALGGA